MADTSLVAVGAVVCASSAVFGWIAVKVQREHRQWCAGRTRTSGVVSRVAERRSTGLSEDATGTPTGAAHHAVAVVRFRAANGFEYEIDVPEAPLQLGTSVEVAYDPAVPSGGRGVERTAKIGPAVVLLVIGAILVAVGASRG